MRGVGPFHVLFSVPGPGGFVFWVRFDGFRTENVRAGFLLPFSGDKVRMAGAGPVNDERFLRKRPRRAKTEWQYRHERNG